MILLYALLILVIPGFLVFYTLELGKLEALVSTPDMPPEALHAAGKLLSRYTYLRWIGFGAELFGGALLISLNKES